MKKNTMYFIYSFCLSIMLIAPNYTAFPGYELFYQHRPPEFLQHPALKSLIRAGKIDEIVKQNLPKSFKMDGGVSLVDYAIANDYFESCLKLIQNKFLTTKTNITDLQKKLTANRQSYQLIETSIETILEKYYHDDTYEFVACPDQASTNEQISLQTTTTSEPASKKKAFSNRMLKIGFFIFNINIKSLIKAGKIHEIVVHVSDPSFQVADNTTMVDYAIAQKCFCTCLRLINRNFQVKNKNLTDLEQLRIDQLTKIQSIQKCITACSHKDAIPSTTENCSPVFKSHVEPALELSKAIMNDNAEEYTRLFSKHNLNPNLTINESRVLEIAIAHGNLRAVKFLTQNGAVVLKTDIEKAESFVHIAACADTKRKSDHSLYSGSPHSSQEIEARTFILKHLSSKSIQPSGILR